MIIIVFKISHEIIIGHNSSFFISKLYTFYLLFFPIALPRTFSPVLNRND